MVTFNTVISLLYEKNNFNVFDFSEYYFEIILIQSSFRPMKARRKYKVYSFIVRNLCKIQRMFRGYNA